MRKTKISWTKVPWNVVTGCSKASAGCDNCYAADMARRLKGMGMKKYSNGFAPTCHPDCLDEPLTWKEPTLVFVPSMGDLFHPQIPDEFIEKVIETIEKTPQHTYQILTKRPSRMAQFFTTHAIPDNAWLGTSVEDARVLHRIETLKTINTLVTLLLILQDKKNANLYDISKSLGHSSLKITETYLSNFDTESQDKTMKQVFNEPITEEMKKEQLIEQLKQLSSDKLAELLKRIE